MHVQSAVWMQQHAWNVAGTDPWLGLLHLLTPALPEAPVLLLKQTNRAVFQTMSVAGAPRKPGTHLWCAVKG